MAKSSKPSILKQPTAVWAIAFACAISFMGIGLVDPILPAISHSLGASASQTMLLFTSYLAITGVAMFFTSWLSGRIGVRNTLIAGLILVVIFASAAGASGTVGSIIGFRAGWGLGNALFISTALAAIVSTSRGGSQQAIILYEAALGIGMAVGPLLGGVLGGITWRAPFFGTAALMAIALLAIVLLLKSPKRTEASADAPSAGSAAGHRPHLLASFAALRNRTLRGLAAMALFYNLGFFILLAYSPYPLEAAAAAAGKEFGAHELGLVFFGWGLALAIASVIVAPLATRSAGLVPVALTMLAALTVILALLGALIHSLPALITLIVVSGFVLGIMNTALTEAVMETTTLPRNVASSAYSGVRFLGGAIAPAVAGPLAESAGAPAPYILGAICVAISFVTMLIVRKSITTHHAV